MNISNTISITEARKRIFDLADKVQSPNSYFVLTEKGVPKAALISASQLESFMETLDVLREFRNIQKDALKAYDDYKTGNYWVLRDSCSVASSSKKTKNGKNLRSNTRLKGKKRVR